MADNICECDICGTTFEVNEDYFKTITLPILSYLDSTMRGIKGRIENDDKRGIVYSCAYDVCNLCLLRLCEVLQGLHSIREEQPQ